MIARAVALLLLAHAATAQADLPAQAEIVYRVLSEGSAVAEITGRFEQAGGRYQLTETWKGKGLYALLGRARRTSEGALDAAGPHPAQFVEERSGRDTSRAWFDWRARILTSRYKGRTRTEPMPPHAQDRLSFILALSFAPADAKSMEFNLVNGRGTSHHVYEFAGRERVRTPAGEFDARKIVRGADDERVEIWLAARLGGLPVRMLAVQGGTQYDQVATRVSAP